MTVCGMPPEFCEFGPTPAKCFAEHPELHEGQEPPAPSAKEKAASSATPAASEEGKQPADASAQTSTSAPQSKTKKNKKKVVITVTQRNKRKSITTIAGLDSFDLKLQEISKMFSKRFACGSTVTKNPSNNNVIEVQGDVATEVAEILEEKYEIPEDSISIVRKEK